MLPYEVYALPTQGTFNVHASLLPQYRGAAPIHWAIMNGETKTGITTFFLNNEIDCGDIILQREMDILPDETTGELYERLKILGAEMALETLTLIEKGNHISSPQVRIENIPIKLAPKIHKKDTIIDWNLSAKDIVNKIRGLSPYPGAVTFFHKNDEKPIAVKIFEATIIQEKTHKMIGKIDTNDKTFLNIYAQDFKISVHNLQIEGKKRQNMASFLQGNKISNYTIYLK
jgi:methionyl-tRNA formyltransferase